MPYDPNFPMIFIPDDNEDITWKDIIISLIIIAVVCFILFKLIEYGLHT